MKKYNIITHNVITKIIIFIHTCMLTESWHWFGQVAVMLKDSAFGGITKLRYGNVVNSTATDPAIFTGRCRV